MSVRIVRLGTDRLDDEGLRIGTVRRPPRGVPKSEFASQNWYDVWYPNLSPTPETMKLGLIAQTDKEWATFVRKFKAEMNSAEPLTDAAKKYEVKQLDAIHEEFIDAVARGRGVAASVVEESFGQGRMLRAADAINAGMADGGATFAHTITRTMKNIRSEQEQARAVAWSRSMRERYRINRA